MNAEPALKPSIDTDACNGHGRCYATAPDIFDCDDDGFPVVVGVADTDDARRELDRAISNCPERAISAAPQL